MIREFRTRLAVARRKAFHRRAVAFARPLFLTALHLGALYVATGGAIAQPLVPGLCPPGGAFHLQVVGWGPPVAGSVPMLKRTLANFPDARCNDGSPAVMYIRPANALNPLPPASRDWLIFFDGGGNCGDADACLLTRWCSGEAPNAEPFDRAAKMSSLGTLPAIRSPGGIFSVPPPPGVVNAFADYNQVLVHYCSSDNWTGSASHRGLTASNGTHFDIQIRGEAIVNAVIATLEGGPTFSDPGPARELHARPLPDLLDARRILIGAESAGTGLRQHLDRLRQELEAVIPEVDVRGVFDAGMAPDYSRADIDWSDSYSPGDYDDFLKGTAQPVTRTFRGTDDTALDASCLDPGFALQHDALGGDPLSYGHPQACYWNTYAQLNHITTPVFVRMDISDPLGARPFDEWNLYPSHDAYWAALVDQLTVFGTDPPPATVLEPPTKPPGIYAPNCGQHVAIQTNRGFFRHTVAPGGAYAVPLTFHDLLVNWLNGLPVGPLTQQIQGDTIALPNTYDPSFCP
jgi:hypothetical protein